MRRTPTRPPRRSRFALIPSARALLALAALALPATAQAQIEDTPPRWVVVTKDATPVRCDDFERFYKVATLDTGALLRTDGRSKQWARVIYPIDVPALVPASDARRIDEKTIELTTPSRLRAPSAILGIAGSWRSLYAEAIPAGTRLEVIETEIGANDEVAAYRVKAPHPPVAPEPPYAYVKLDAIRDATPAEVKAHLKALSAIPGASPVPVETAQIIPDAVEIKERPAAQPASTTPETAQSDSASTEPTESEPPTAPEQVDVVEITDAPVASDDAPPMTTNAPAGDRASDTLLEPMVLPGQEDAAGSASTGEHAPPTQADEPPQSPVLSVDRADDEAGAESGAPVGDAGAEAAIAEPEQITLGGAPQLSPEPASIEDLEQALVAARRLPAEALDEALDELLAEYQRTLSAEQDKGQDEKVLDALRRRIAWLELRIKTRDQRRALDEALARASSQERTISQQLSDWQANRSYTMVGRLAPSAIYDGRRLPLMYRVQSVDPLTGPRTIGYLRPAPGERLDHRLGQIVGVIGETTDDDALSLRIIQPERVDALNADAFATVPTP